ncbi:hypothetical protein V6N12_070305 [Hibiscus sabdariffa]|uniref:NAD(P)-binding domain-containing protein n=1 Tax=Hibiscus sabdariffa TaxID=183260 RepID=A0ABR2FGE4_9ROSI
MEICQLSGRFFSAIPLQFNNCLRKSAGTPKFSVFWNKVSCYRTEKTGQDSGNRMFILGMGFVGQFFAQELLNEGWVVSGTCTSMKKRNELEQRGFDVILFDANQPEMDTMNSLKSCTHLLVSIPPVMGIGDPMLQHGELLRSTLMDGNLQWLCYLSSTSVYGDCGGACVDEDYPASPTNEMSKLRLAAEQGWLKVAHDVGIKAHVFRLGVRVHVADISQALKASVHIQLSRRIYNIVDDDPASRKEVFAYALDLVEKKWPSLTKEITSRERAEPFGQKASLRGEKQVSNARMKKELGDKYEIKVVKKRGGGAAGTHIGGGGNVAAGVANEGGGGDNDRNRKRCPSLYSTAGCSTAAIAYGFWVLSYETPELKISENASLLELTRVIQTPVEKEDNE